MSSQKIDILKDPLICFLIKEARKSHIPLYLVGGIPRDILLGKTNFTDYDFVTIGKPYHLGNILKEKFNGKLLKFHQFKTVEIRIGGKLVDITMARREKYPYPGSLPVVYPVSSIEEDLERRDFTINAMAVSLCKKTEGEFIDPFKGKDDIKRKKIRVLASFRDDPTRALRAIRYKNRFSFDYALKTKEEFEKAKKHIDKISFFRIKKELLLFALETKRVPMFYELYRRNLIKQYHPSLSRRLQKRELELLNNLILDKKNGWIAFFSLFVKSYFEFENLTSTEKNFLKEVLAWRKKVKQFRSLNRCHFSLNKASELAVLTLSIWNPILRKYEKKRKEMPKLLNGKEISSLGFKGTDISKVKKILESEWIEGNIRNKDDAIKYLKKNLQRV